MARSPMIIFKDYLESKDNAMEEATFKAALLAEKDQTTSPLDLLYEVFKCQKQIALLKRCLVDSGLFYVDEESSDLSCHHSDECEILYETACDMIQEEMDKRNEDLVKEMGDAAEAVKQAYNKALEEINKKRPTADEAPIKEKATKKK